MSTERELHLRHLLADLLSQAASDMNKPGRFFHSKHILAYQEALDELGLDDPCHISAIEDVANKTETEWLKVKLKGQLL